MDEDEDEALDTSAMSQKEAARESATRQVLDESAKVRVYVGKLHCMRKHALRCHRKAQQRSMV